MKSKVYLFPIVLVLCFKLNESKPTFGDEFVHIKVHLPKEGGEAHAHHGPQPIHAHSIVHATPPPHKVVHHFHQKRRRPAKKTTPFGKHTGLLESIILSEVKKPISSDHYKYLNHAEDIAKHIDTFIVKPEKPKAHVETYKLIEEVKPKEKVETFKVIESKVPQKHFQPHDDSYHLHNGASVASFENGYPYKSHKPTETYKVIESLLDDYHTHVQDPDYQYLPTKKQRVQTVKIVDSHEHEPSSHGHYDYSSQEYNNHDDSYQYATKSHAESVQIVETNVPLQQSHEYSINFDKRPHRETVQIVKTNKPSKSNSYYSRHQHHQHFDGSEKNHGYHYQGPSVGSTATSYDGGFSAGHDYQTPTYKDTYRTIPEEHYSGEPEQYAPEVNYLPPKRHGSTHHHHQRNHQHHQHNRYHNSIRQNSLSDDETVSATDPTLPSFNEPYLPPPPPALPELEHGGASDVTKWSQQDDAYKATETYSGIDSYSAAHVQGLGSGGYQYPSPYP